MVLRSLSFMLLAGIVSCTGDPTSDLHGGVERLAATPTQAFAPPDSTIAVEITALDATGNPVEAGFRIQGSDPELTVERDLEFMPIYNDKGELVPNPRPTTIRYLVTATAPTGNYDFTVSGGGKEVTVTLRVRPKEGLDLVTVSSLTPGAGDEVTFTVPAPYRFTAEAEATPSESGVFIVTGVSGDNRQLTAIASPGLAGTVSFTGVTLDYAPTTEIAVTMPDEMVSGALEVAFSSATPAAGAELEITLPEDYVFTEHGDVTFDGVHGYHMELDETDPTILRVIPPVGYSGTAELVGIAFASLPTVEFGTSTLNAVDVADPLAGTATTGTAPVIAFPATVGTTTTLYDGGDYDGVGGAGSVGARFYRIDVAAGSTARIALDWSGGADMDFAVRNSTNTGSACGSLTAAHPEVVAACVLPAGTYYVRVDYYAGDQPGVIVLTIRRDV